MDEAMALYFKQLNLLVVYLAVYLDLVEIKTPGVIPTSLDLGHRYRGNCKRAHCNPVDFSAALADDLFPAFTADAADVRV